MIFLEEKASVSKTVPQWGKWSSRAQNERERRYMTETLAISNNLYSLGAYFSEIANNSNS